MNVTHLVSLTFFHKTAPSRFCNLYSFSNFQRVSFTARLPVSKINSFLGLRRNPVKNEGKRIYHVSTRCPNKFGAGI